MSDLIFAAIVVIVPICFIGYGVYAFINADRLNSRFGGPPTTAARVLFRVIACLGVAMGLLISVVLIVNLAR